MALEIRRAGVTDCPRLLELVKELAVYEKAPEEVTVSLDHFIESGFGPSPVWWAFVVEDGQPDGTKKVIGFALYYIRYSTWKGQRMYLEDIVVTAQARGRGAGKMLLDRLIVEARERKLNGIVWQVLEWNKPAIHFYKKYNARFDPEWVNCVIDV